MEKTIYNGVPVFKSRAVCNENTKDLFLNHAKKTPKWAIEAKELKLSRCDWHVKYFGEKPYWPFVLETVRNHLDVSTERMGFNVWNILEHWYQWYEEGDFHDWHVHGNSMMTAVYYLNLPKNSPSSLKCVFMGTEFSIPIQEGDIITFPSFVYHKAAKHNSTEPKIIFSFNYNMEEGNGYFGG